MDMIIPCRILFTIMFIYYISDLIMAISKKAFYRVRMSEIEDRRNAYSELDMMISFDDLNNLYYPISVFLDILKCLLKSWIFVYIANLTGIVIKCFIVVVLQVFSFVYSTMLDIVDKTAIATKEEEVKYHKCWLLLKVLINISFCIIGLIITFFK